MKIIKFNTFETTAPASSQHWSVTDHTLHNQYLAHHFSLNSREKCEVNFS